MLERQESGRVGGWLGLLMGMTPSEDPCRATPDGWCSTHSTSDGPVYCKDTRPLGISGPETDR